MDIRDRFRFFGWLALFGYPWWIVLVRRTICRFLGLALSVTVGSPSSYRLWGADVYDELTVHYQSLFLELALSMTVGSPSSYRLWKGGSGRYDELTVHYKSLFAIFVCHTRFTLWLFLTVLDCRLMRLIKYLCLDLVWTVTENMSH